jgi:hypothetical protein
VLPISLCIVLVAAGLVVIVRRPAAMPRYGAVRYLAGAVAAGLGAGILAAGAGGRLVMRLLAVTSPDAEGSLTEAGEIVGEITLGGTLGFIVFNGIAVGLLSAVLCALLRPVLPRGLAGGAVLGALMLVVVGSRVDPLRADNFDFNIVGPTWLAVLAFAVLALFQGMLTIALAERISAPPPLTGRLLTAGRIVVGVVVVVALPGFVGALAEIT